MERATRDDRPGRIFWSGAENHAWEGMDRGRMDGHGAQERLNVTIFMERFDNGAHPILNVEFRADRPEEVRLTVHAAEDSATMDYCILSATMGNYARLRRLLLRDRAITPADIWPGYSGSDFTQEAQLPGDRIPRIRGDLLLCAETDEPDPGAVAVDPAAPHWRYRGSFAVTQYWRKPRGTWRPDVRVRVNARRTYWASASPIPGGLAFENFELSERFYPGQTAVFGVTRRTPAELGVTTDHVLAVG
jgi:hypothetical protein